MKLRVISGLVAGAVSLLSGTTAAQHHGMCAGEVKPILSVGDIDGDGSVTHADVNMLSAQVDSGEYIAFFDLNADSVLDGKDVSAAAKAMGASSTVLDQQLAELFWATESFRDQQTAIASGFRPFTQQMAGHGGHFVRLPLRFEMGANGVQLDQDWENTSDTNLDLSEPEGLNFDENGELAAVFFYHGTNIRDWVLVNAAEAQQPTPQGQAAIAAMAQESLNESMQSAMSGGMYPMIFNTHEALWHQHWGGCWNNLDYVAMSFNPAHEPQFINHTLPAECHVLSPNTNNGWLPAFNMLHVWLYKLNPCGTFAGTHPHISQNFPEEPDYREGEMWFHMMEMYLQQQDPNAQLPYPYGDGGHH